MTAAQVIGVALAGVLLGYVIRVVTEPNRRRPFRGTYDIDRDEPADVDPADFQPVAALVLLSALTVAQAKTESARLRGVDSDVGAR